MLKDLSGFVPHNNSMDAGLLNVLHDLDYKWVSVLGNTSDTAGRATDKEDSGSTVVPGLILVKTYEDINSIIFPMNAPAFVLEDKDKKEPTYQEGTTKDIRANVWDIMRKYQDSIEGCGVFKLHVPDVLVEKDLRNKLNQLATVLEEFDSLGITVHSVQEIIKKIHREKIIKFESMSNNEINYSDENVTTGESELQNINVVDSKKISKLKKEMGEIVSSVHIVKNIYDITPITIWRPDVNREINDPTMSEYINIVNTFGLIGSLIETRKEIEEKEMRRENTEYHEYTTQINNKIHGLLSLIEDDNITMLIKEIIQ
jgi:DNA-directed RNA polymerase subunit F